MMSLLPFRPLTLFRNLFSSLSYLVLGVERKEEKEWGRMEERRTHKNSKHELQRATFLVILPLGNFSGTSSPCCQARPCCALWLSPLFGCSTAKTPTAFLGPLCILHDYTHISVLRLGLRPDNSSEVWQRSYLLQGMLFYALLTPIC